MKKHILILISSLITGVGYTQTLPSTITMGSTLGNTGTAKTYQYTDSTGNTQNIISPTPGVYINTPQWVKDISDIAKDNKANKNNATNNLKETEQNDLTKNTNTTTQNTNEKSQPAQETTISTSKQTVNEKKTGQTLDQKPDLYTNQIGDWNKSTLNEFEESGKKKLETSYRKFLASH